MTEPRRSGPARPLRWAKFGFYLAVQAATLALAQGPLRELLRIARGPFSDAPRLPPPSLWLPVAAIALATAAWLVADAALDRRVPKSVLVASIAALAAALVVPAASAGGEGGLERQPGEVQLAFLVGRIRELAAGEVGRTGQVPGDAARLTAEARRPLPRTSFRDRTLRALPPRVVVVADRGRPVLEPLPGDPPGTVYLSVGEGGTHGWVTGVVLADDGRPTLLALDGKPVVGGVTAAETGAADGAPDGPGTAENEGSTRE